MICPSTIVDYLLGENGAMRFWYYSYILATHTWQKHKSETSLSKIAILVDRKTNHYYPNNQTVSSMIPIMLSKTPSPQVLVSQFKPNLHLFTTFWTLVTNLDKLVNVKIQQQYGDILGMRVINYTNLKWLKMKTSFRCFRIEFIWQFGN